jgi:hypothetical protein
MGGGAKGLYCSAFSSRHMENRMSRGRPGVTISDAKWHCGEVIFVVEQ